MSTGARNPPRLLVITNIAIASIIVVPVIYLMLRAFSGTTQGVMEIVLRWRNLRLLGNTRLLVVGVLIVTTAISVPMAWFTTRTDMRGKGIWAFLGILPLAIPSYLMAYAMLSIGGRYGMAYRLFGLELPRPGSYWGSLMSLSLYTFPYLFLNLRAAFMRINPSLEESGRSLGLNNWQVFRRVTIPLFSPAFFAGSLLVGLHVLGDFGTVSLMRYETFSYALYLQYIASFDHIYSSWLALILLLITVTMLVFEARFMRGMRFHHIGRGTQKQTTLTNIGRWKIVAYAFCLCVLVVSVLLPAGTIIFWLSQGGEYIDWAELLISLWNSFSASAPAAVLTIVFALPLAYMGVRYSSRLSGIVQRIAYIGYAIPGLAFALGWLFVSLKSFPGIYQTLLLLIFSYTFHFLAEAVGPIRTALYQAKPELEEAARSLGYSRWKSFLLVTLPPIRRGVIVSMAFVFLSAMKELSMTFVLSPLGRETLAVNVWGYIDEAMFSEAAPFALAIFLFSAIFMGLLLIMEKEHS